MATFVVSGVTLGKTGKVGGGTRVNNKAGNTVTFGFDSLCVSRPLVSLEVNGRRVDIDLATDYTPPVGSSLSLPLSGSPVVLAGIGDQSATGTPKIENAADPLLPNSVPPGGFGSRTIASFRIGGRAVGLELSGSYAPPDAINVGLYFNGPAVASALTAGDNTRFGQHEVESPPTIQPDGCGLLLTGVPAIYGEDHNGWSIELDLSGDYAPLPGTAVALPLAGAPLVLAGAGQQGNAGHPGIENTADALYPSGWEGSHISSGHVASPPMDARLLELRLSGNYEPPSADGIQLQWAVSDKNLSPKGFESSQWGEAIVRVESLFLDGIPAGAFGEHEIINQLQRVLVDGWCDAQFNDAHDIWNYVQRVMLAGFDALGISDKHQVIDTTKPIESAGGFDASLYGDPLIYNLLQFLRLSGHDASDYGKPWDAEQYRDGALVKGGVKRLHPKGLHALKFGRPDVINTTADRNIGLKGIKPPRLPAPNVSPRILYPDGVYGTLITESHVVQFPPQPKGFRNDAYGVPWVSRSPRSLTPVGVTADELVGYPAVRDRARWIQHAGIIRSAIFGDILLNNIRALLQADGFDALRMPKFASVHSNRRYYELKGWDGAGFGDTDIHNKTPSLIPNGLGALLFPAPAAGHGIRYVRPSGWDKSGLGRPAMDQTPSLAPKGFAGQAGAPTVTFYARRVRVDGQDQQLFGETATWFRYRYIELEDNEHGFNATRFGRSTLDHEVRTLWAKGASKLRLGRAQIEALNRTIEPEGVWNNFAHEHMVGGLLFLRPAGYIATRWGERIIPERQTIYHDMWDAAAVEWPMVGNLNRFLKATGFASFPQSENRWGKAETFNLVQYIDQYYINESGLTPPGWSKWTSIANRDKTLGVTGKRMDHFGYALIANGARLILPDGIHSGVISGDDMVAYRVRPLLLSGMEAPYLSGWTVVYNDADVLSPSGFSGQRFGHGEVVNTRRRFYIQSVTPSAYGYPVVAYRVRDLDIEKRYSIAPPIIRLPDVQLYTRYIGPEWQDRSQLGWASLFIHWNRITPRWTLRHFFGMPDLHNVTPELLTRGRNAEAFGDALVRLEWRRVTTNKTYTQIIPKPIIAFRDRAFPVRGMQALAFGDKLKVILLGSPPYSEQTITLKLYGKNGKPADGYGIGVDKDQVSLPTLNQQVIYHHSKSSAERFGDQRITANTVSTKPGIYLRDYIGKQVVSLKIRTVYADKFDDKRVFEPSEEGRVTPHTIWATTRTPFQAQINNPGRVFMPVDTYPYKKRGLGRPTVVRTGDQYLRHRGRRASRLSRPVVINSRTFVYPDGISSLRVGWHMLPGDQYSELFDAYKGGLFGEADVRFPPYTGPQTIAPIGLAGVFGNSSIELFHHTVKARGHFSQSMGGKKSGDSPYMWQGMRVGELVPTIPDGFNSDGYGDTWFSHWVREMLVEGFDGLRMEYDLRDFEKRMTVEREEEAQPFDTLDVEPIRIFRQGFHCVNHSDNYKCY